LWARCAAKPLNPVARPCAFGGAAAGDWTTAPDFPSKRAFATCQWAVKVKRTPGIVTKVARDLSSDVIRLRTLDRMCHVRMKVMNEAAAHVTNHLVDVDCR